MPLDSRRYFIIPSNRYDASTLDPASLEVEHALNKIILVFPGFYGFSRSYEVRLELDNLLPSFYQGSHPVSDMRIHVLRLFWRQQRRIMVLHTGRTRRHLSFPLRGFLTWRCLDTRPYGRSGPVLCRSRSGGALVTVSIGSWLTGGRAPVTLRLVRAHRHRKTSAPRPADTPYRELPTARL